MIKSMTAFGRAKQVGEKKDITIELKSVNSRFFDCNVKLPRAYIFLEERIKEHVRKNAVSRAKVDVFVTVDNHTSGLSNVGLDAPYLESYLSALFSLPSHRNLRPSAMFRFTMWRSRKACRVTSSAFSPHCLVTTMAASRRRC